MKIVILPHLFLSNQPLLNLVTCLNVLKGFAMGILDTAGNCLLIFLYDGLDMGLVSKLFTPTCMYFFGTNVAGGLRRVCTK